MAGGGVEQDRAARRELLVARPQDRRQTDAGQRLEGERMLGQTEVAFLQNSRSVLTAVGDPSELPAATRTTQPLPCLPIPPARTTSWNAA